MATAAKLTVVQTHHIAELGTLDPKAIATSGIYVDRVFPIPRPREAPVSTASGQSHADLARCVALDIPEDWCVDLGTGLPTMVADYIPEGREVVLHSENDTLSMVPAPAPVNVNP